MHWQFKEPTPRAADPLGPWHPIVFGRLLNILDDITHLDTLSIFCQGRLDSYDSFKTIISQLRYRHTLSSPNSMFVRLPWLSPGFTTDHEKGLITAMLTRQNLPFKICRQPLKAGEEGGELADHDIIDDTGWRMGSMFLPSDNEETGYATTSYTVFAPMPKRRVLGRWEKAEKSEDFILSGGWAYP